MIFLLRNPMELLLISIQGTHLFVFGSLGVFARCGQNKIERNVQDSRQERYSPARWTPRIVVEINGHIDVIEPG